MLFNFATNFSQEKKVEEIFQECVYNSLVDNGKMLKFYTKGFENYLIETNILKDSTSKSYYGLFKSFYKNTISIPKLDYAYLDSINKYESVIRVNRRCDSLMIRSQNYKSSKIFKIRNNSTKFSKEDSNEALEKVINILEESDFRMDFYKIGLLSLLYIESAFLNEEKQYSEQQIENAIQIDINSEGKIYLENKVLIEQELRQLIFNYVTDKKDESLIVIGSERDLLYKKYIEIIDVIKSGVSDVRKSLARAKFNETYSQLDTNKREEIDLLIPLNIKELAPVEKLRKRQ